MLLHFLKNKREKGEVNTNIMYLIFQMIFMKFIKNYENLPNPSCYIMAIYCHYRILHHYCRHADDDDVVFLWLCENFVYYRGDNNH